MRIAQYEHEANEQSVALLSDMHVETLAATAERHTVTLPLGETAFKAIILPGESKDAALIFPGEFGNGLKSYGALARAEVARAYMRSSIDVDPSVIVLPNTTFGENNVNFTLDERKQVVEGSPTPLVDRMNVATEYTIGDQAGQLIVGALSQGTYPGLRFAAERDNVALGVAEVPNVSSLGAVKFAKTFLKDLLARPSNNAQVKYMLGCLKEENRSLAFMMGSGTRIESDIKSTLDRGGSVVHASSGNSRLSPLDGNQEIARKFEHYLRYESVISRDGDLSIANDYAFIAAILRRADELRALRDSQ